MIRENDEWRERGRDRLVGRLLVGAIRRAIGSRSFRSQTVRLRSFSSISASAKSLGGARPTI